MTSNALTIVLAEPTDLTRRTRETLDAWAAADLLRRTLWVDLDEQTAVDPTAPIAASWIGGDAEADMLRAIAEQPYELYRVVALQVVDRAEGGSVLEAASRVHTRVDRALAATQRLTRLNVLVPAADLKDLSTDRLSVHAEANIVAAPEDRISPRHSSVSVHEPDDLANHAAGVLATVGGIWTTMGDAPFDGEELQASAGNPQVVVVRSFGRFLQVHGAVDDVTEELFELRRAGSWAASAAGGVGARDPQAIVARLARQYLEKHAERFSFQPKPEPVRPKLETVGIFAAFLMMFRYIAKGLKDLPGDLIDRATSRVKHSLSDFAQRVTFGQESVVAVTFGGAGDGPAGQPAAMDATDAAAGVALQLLDQVTGEAPTPPAAGDSWRDLRRTAFGASDGGSMPDGIDEPRDGTRREIINHPEELAPDPTEGPFVLDRERFSARWLPPIVYEPIRVCDPFQARTVEQVLEEALDRALHPEKYVDPDADIQPEDLEPDEELAAQIQSALTQLQRWVQAREGSLVWRLAEHVSGQFSRARQSLIQALARVRQGEADLNESALERAQKKLRRWWLAITLLVGLGSWFAHAQLSPNLIDTTTELAGHIGISVVIWLIGMVWVFIRYQRRMFQIKYEYDRAHVEYLDSIERAIDSAREVASIASIYDQLRDWAEVVGWLLHRPEGVIDREEPEAVDAGELPTPLSTVMTAGEVSEQARRRASALVGRQVFGAGWMSELYGRYASDSMDNLKYEQGLTDADPTPDPDWHLSEPAPRRYLLGELEEGRLAEAWTEEVRSSVASEMAGMPPNELLTTIDEDVPDRIVDPAEFFSVILPTPGEEQLDEELSLSLWTGDARMRAAGTIGRHIIWAPEAMDIVAVNGLEQRDLSDATVSDSRVFTMASVRLDASAVVSHRDLAIFSQRVDEEVADLEAEPDDVW